MASKLLSVNAIIDNAKPKNKSPLDTRLDFIGPKKPNYSNQSNKKGTKKKKENSSESATKQDEKKQSDKTAQKSADKTEENFVWDKSYIKTAKENAVKKTNSGTPFVDRYKEYYENLKQFSKEFTNYFKNSYDGNGDLLRKNVSDLRQEAIELSKQLEKNKDEIIAANGIDKYNQAQSSLNDIVKDLKIKGKAIISQRDVVNSFKNDENYKDDNARKAAYDDYCYDKKLYYKYGELDYKKRNSEIERLNNKKNKYKEKGLDTTKIDRKINWLEGYSQKYGYQNDNYYKEQMAGYDQELDNLNKKIQTPDKNNEEFKKYAKEQYEKIYDFHGSDSDFDMIWDSFDKNDSVVVEFWQKFNGKKIKEIQGQKEVLEKLRNKFEDYNDIISKYDDVTNNEEYQKTSSKISKETKNSFIKDYNTNEVYKHMGKGDIDEIDEDDLDILNDNEVKILNFYLNHNQKEKAFKFINDIRKSQDYGAREQRIQYQKIKDAPWYEQILHTVLSVPASVVGGVTSAIGDFANKITGQKLNPYDDMHALSNYAETARSAVSDTIAENAGSAFSWLYNSGLGIADFLSELLITKNVGKAMGLSVEGTSRLMQGIVSTSAYSSTAMQAKKDGCDDATAISLGLLSGSIEWATEKYSIESLMNIKPGDKLWKSIYKNAVVEGSEEGASSVANFFVDLAIQGETSEHKEKINEYIKYGYTEAEAKQKAYLDLGKQVVSDIAAGALMGSSLGGGTAIAANITKKNILSGEYAKSYGQAVIITNADQEVITNAQKLGISTKEAERALKTLENVGKMLEADKENQALKNEYQTQFEKTADTLSELEYNIEQNGGKTEIDGDKLKLALNGSDNLNNSSTINDADIEETSTIVENDLKDRGITNQDRIVNHFKEKNAGEEATNINDIKQSTGDAETAQKIQVGMSDSERTAILKDKTMTVAHYDGQSDELIKQNDTALESKKTSVVKKALKKVADFFGNYGNYNIKDFDVEVSYSSNSIKESASKITDKKVLAKLFPVIDEAIENAIGISSENNRYYYDRNNLYYHTLLSGYIDGDYFVPIRLGVKENTEGKNKLYVVIGQNKIDLRVLKLPGSKNERNNSRLRSDLSISEIIKNVNSKDLLRYLPDDMISDSQRKIKYEGIAETIKYTNDKNDRKYAEYVKNGDLASAKQMVEAKAKAMGFDIKAYKEMSNSEANVFDEEMSFSENKDDLTGSNFDNEFYEVFLKIKNPYEANTSEDVSKDELMEKGYDGIHSADNESWVAFYPSQVKSADAITYDENGEVIPISERFNENSDDIKFSADDTVNNADIEETSTMVENDLKDRGITNQDRIVNHFKEKNAGEEATNINEENNNYSYNKLTSKPDMKITKMGDVSDADLKRYNKDTKTFANDMVEIARKENNPKNTATATYLHNDDTNSDIMIAKTSFRHGAARVDKSYINVSKNLSSILKNAIAVNELNPRENSNGTKVFIGTTEYGDNYVFVRMVVDNRTQSLNDYDILYAIKKSSIKKEEVGFKPTDYLANKGSDTSSTISISDLLENVKNVDLVNSVLSKDVCQKLGITRSDSVFKDSLKYSVNDEVESYNEKDYNNFGWVRANDVLTANEYNHFNTSFSDNKNLDFKFTKNPTTKETIIPTGDNQNSLNVLVYTKGTFKNPTITKVVRINSNDTTDIAIIRSEILEYESRGSENSYANVQKVFGNEFTTIIERQDLQSFQEYQRERERSIGTENTGYSQFDIERKDNRTENSTNSEAGLDNSAFSIDENNNSNEENGAVEQVNDTNIEETSTMVQNDLKDRGITNQDRIVNHFRENNIGKEVNKISDGKLKVEGVIRTDKQARKVEAFNEENGLQTVWFKNSYVKDKNGNYVKVDIGGFTNGNKIYLNADLPIENQIFKHEYHHTLEIAKGFEKYTARVEKSTVFKDWISKKAEALGVDGDYQEQYNSVINDYINKQKKVKGLTDTQAKNEVFADFMTEELFSGKDFNETMDKLNEAFEDRSAFQKFVDVIKDIISKIKEAFGGSASVEALERNIVKLQREINSEKVVKNNTNKKRKITRNGGLTENNSVAASGNLSNTNISQNDNNSNNISKNAKKDTKFSVAGENAKTADKLKLSTAEQMENDGVDSETIRKKTGWYKGGDGHWRFRIADNEMRLYYNKLSEEPITLGECIKHDKLFEAYPQLKDFSVRLAETKGNLRGKFNSKEIIIKSSLSPIQKKRTLIHEIQHYIQSVENFARGGTRKTSIFYVINDIYNVAIKQSEYKKLKTPNERLEFIFSLAEKRFNVKGIDNVAFEAYRNLYGEVEARETSDLMNFDEEFLKYVEPNTDGKVANVKKEKQKFVDNMQKMGYTEDEINTLFRGAKNDEPRSEEIIGRRHTRTSRSGIDRLRRIFSTSGIGTLQTERVAKGTTGGNRRGISSVLQISNDEAGLDNNSAFSNGENTKFSVDKDLNTSENSVENDENNGIMDLYRGKGIEVVSNSKISSKTAKQVKKATKKVTSDFKALETYSEPITFGNVDGGIAENRFNPNTGLNFITLRQSDFSNPDLLLKSLKNDYISGMSFDTDSIQSLVAHEMGHNAHIALALKRAGIPYGKPLTAIESHIFYLEYNKISQEIYTVAFNDESFDEIQNQCIEQLGSVTYGNSHELIAQSFSNYYYGKEKSEIAIAIVKYFKEGLK